MSTRNLALVGAGYWGKNLARNFHALGALNTLVDLSPKILETYGSEYHGVRKTRNVEELWSEREITMVVIAAPAMYHYRLAKEALMAGKDVFVEKPLCLDPTEAQELVTLAAECKLILMVGHLLQYHPLVQKLQQLTSSGELGALHYLTSNRLNLGKIRREENALWSFAPHDISVILSLAGNKLPEQIQCTGGAYISEGVADTTLTTMAFTGGLRAHVYVSWLNPFKEQKLTVVGSHGMAVFDDTRIWGEKLGIYRNYLKRDADQNHVPTKASVEYAVVPESEPLRAECEHFLVCCRLRTQPRTDGAEGLRVLQVLKSAQSRLDSHGESKVVAGR